MRLRQKNIAWLAVLGAMIAVALLSGVATPMVAATLIGVYLIALAATLIDLKPERILDQSRSSLAAMRMSPEAREAVERAKRRSSSAFAPPLQILDIGLIAAQSAREGMTMRRSRQFSREDDGVRPFVVLHVPPEDADRNAVVRFEILDQNGEQQYIHEMRAYLRDGEMNLLADHQLPLATNDRLRGTAGEWDLRVSVDGALVGILGFNVAPSLEDRFPQRDTRHLEDTPREDTPMRLEDLLRDRNRNQR